jgi:5-methylcytosine-specific restriction endonuclease McrA
MDKRKKSYLKKIQGVMVKISSQRYPVFQRSLKCARCGVEGKYLAIERCEGKRMDKTFHLNLYAINARGHEVIMTKDHIIPKSKGGSNTQDNYQTMCLKCNGKKGNKLETC